MELKTHGQLVRLCQAITDSHKDLAKIVGLEVLYVVASWIVTRHLDTPETVANAILSQVC